GGNGQTRQVLQLVPLLAGTAQQYHDQLVTVAELADPVAVELAGEEAGHIGGTQAQGPGALLIDVQVDYLARLLPVQVDMVDRRAAPYLRGDLPGHTARLIDMLAGDTELDSIALRRAVLHPGDAGAHLGVIACVDLHQPSADLLAIF